ncbi:MAG: lytic murein transglycosylase [Sheuella sp.]|nr:lytic murein transglycosylase [Sheuella sp.]
MKLFFNVSPCAHFGRISASVLFLVACALPAFNTHAQSFDSCITSLRKSALTQGISAQTFDQAIKGVEPDPDVLKAYDYQPEFRTPIWDYISGLVDDERVQEGRAQLSKWAQVLAQAEQEYGVDRHAIVAVWGVESNFGAIKGRRELVRSLATLVCANKRETFFRGELMATLRILQSGDIAPEYLVGSWAGAFGQTQFMPTTYQRLAVDFDGDGRRDIVNSIPDALGSTANFLKKAGWITGQPWGYEVTLPENYSGPSGRKTKQSLAQWKSLGVKRMASSGKKTTNNSLAQVVPETTQAALILPAGAKGPAFLVFKNFDAIYGYNAAESYALSIAHLSDRMKGGAGIQTPWPTDDPGTSRAERREIQRLLIVRGYDIGEADGLVGAKTRVAISAFQTSTGQPGDGRAGQKVLKALREAK